MVNVSAMVRSGFPKLFGALLYVFNIALHIESLLGQIVVLAFDHFLKAAYGFRERNVLALTTRELLSHVERLRQQTLDLASTCHSLLVVFRKFVDAEDRNNV